MTQSLREALQAAHATMRQAQARGDFLPSSDNMRVNWEESLRTSEAALAAPADVRDALPKLTDAMYHAARGCEIVIELTFGPAFVLHVTDELLEEIWDAINTALRVGAIETSSQSGDTPR